MKKTLSLILILFFVFSGHALWAGHRIKGGKIRLNLERTPQYKDSRHGTGGSNGYWLAVRTEFEMVGNRDEWVDEMEMNYKILIPRKNGRLVLLEQSHVMTDVKCGEKLRTVVFVRPTFLKKITGNSRAEVNKISAYVDYRVNGELLHREPITYDASGMPKNWFKSKDLGRMKKYVSDIQPRFRTPFSVLDYDYYVPEKQD